MTSTALAPNPAYVAGVARPCAGLGHGVLGFASVMADASAAVQFDVQINWSAQHEHTVTTKRLPRRLDRPPT